MRQNSLFAAILFLICTLLSSAIRPVSAYQTSGAILYIAGADQKVGIPADVFPNGTSPVILTRPKTVPASAEELKKYNLIVIDNVRASELSRVQMRAIAIACKEYGVGFCMLGGRNSFASGGYRGTQIEEMLPVSMDVKPGDRPESAAVAVVIEEAEAQAFETWPKEVCKLTASLLEPCDWFGVLDCNGSFLPDPKSETEGQWLVPLELVHDIDALRFQIQKIANLGDPSSYAKFLRNAHRQLVKTGAKVKHIILVGDGDAIYEEGVGKMPELLKAIKAAGVTVSTIAYNCEKPEIKFMKQIADLGGGRAYVALTGKDIANIVSADMSAIGQSVMRTGPTRVRSVEGDTTFSGIDWAASPALIESNPGMPRPDAVVVLATAGSGSSPLVARGRFGAGRVTAILFQPQGPQSWSKWTDYSAFWRKILAWHAARGDNPAL